MSKYKRYSIDQSYHSELPFLLSAWCGFMALLLSAIPKELYKEETLYPLNEIGE